jgi:hypothetical protein
VASPQIALSAESSKKSTLFLLRRNMLGISGAKFDIVEEGCKPRGSREVATSRRSHVRRKPT